MYQTKWPVEAIQENITMDEQKPDTWTGCYDLGWGDLLVPAAYSHPAKMSRSLVFKIVAHALEEGWLQPGQWILDPFGGVGTTALPTLMAGLNYIGVELEQKFVELGRQNIALWNSRFSGMPKWTGSATLLQGDSRRLAEVVGAAGLVPLQGPARLVVSSPPYADSFTRSRDEPAGSGGRKGGNGKGVAGAIPAREYGLTPCQLATLPPGDISAVISSPPFAGNSGGRGEASRNGIDSALFDRHSGGMKKGTGSDPANLDHLKTGTPPVAIVGSPPYAEGLGHDAGHPRLDATEDKRRAEVGSGRRNGYGKSEGQLGSMAVIGSPPFADSVGSDDPDKRGGLFRDEKRRNDTNLTGTYGQTDGQLGGMKAGAVVGSPPYSSGTVIDHDTIEKYNELKAKVVRDGKGHAGKFMTSADGYGSAPGQLGTVSPDTFWAAARLIVEQCALLLPPGGAAIWVVKAYVKGGKIVDFPGQWRQLCEACGFETVHEHRAMLVKKNGAQAGFDGGMVSKDVSRKSFFRRLHERRRPDLAIDWETVLCTVKK